MICSRSLDELLPWIKPHVIAFLAAAEMRLGEKFGTTVRWKVSVTSTYRDNEYQDFLYSKGRTIDGPKVTSARGGDSWHNYRCAWDVMILVDNTATWENRYYAELGAVAKELGIVWGGDWDGDGKKDPEDWDLVHFQMTGGLKLADLKAGQIPAPVADVQAVEAV